ncbi:MAG: SusD/RagB family nutrient-binding outer membrane lipoprotein [Cyclobacteriaceae bacterium]|nr:SusD/RagB family nutrient-binding outer membrane lipoprotein [Cyclobacteriaceae bacterium]
MKNIKIFFVAVVVLFTSFSCDKVLDINTDPLAATAADPNAVLPYVIVQYSNRKITELGTRMSDVPQYISACFNSPRRGPTTSFLTGNTWNMMYVQVLGNLSLVEKDALAAGPTSNNVAAIAKILSSLIYYELTSIWGDVPYTEAINGQEFQSPKFDTQETVLRGVVSDLDEAMTLIDTREVVGEFKVSQGDLIYGGDMDMWRRYANSLKLRVLMMLRNKDTSVDTQIATCLSQPLIDDNSQVAILPYSNSPGGMNAWQNILEAFFGNDNESVLVHGPGIPFHDLLVAKNDPRYGLFIYDPNNGGSPGNGIFPTPTTAAIRNNVIRRDLSDLWFLAAEVSFYKAELALKGVAAAGDANTNYQTGVRQILEFWGQDIPGAQITLDNPTIDAYIAGLTAPTLNEVYEQEYLAAFMCPVLAWNHVRRNKIPALSPPSNTSITTILKRFTYPPAEISANPNTPTNLATDVPMWFEN